MNFGIFCHEQHGALPIVNGQNRSGERNFG